MIIEKDIALCEDSSEKILSQIVSNQLPIAIWGLGGMISFIMDNFKAYGVHVDYIIENNIEKCGNFFEGTPIISFAELKSRCKDCNILIGVVTPKFVKEIQTQISQDGQYNKVYFFELFYPFHSSKEMILQGLNKIHAVCDFLADEKSQQVYAAKILYMATKQPGLLDTVSDNCDDQYFDKDIIHLSDKTGLFIDGGAFHGENTDELFRRYHVPGIRSVCIDADESNIAVLKNKYQDNDKVDVRFAALHEKNGKILFANSGDRGGKVSDTSEGQSVCTIGIDDEFKDQKIAFIKLDIEGSEKECLKGAKNCIMRDKPILAVCIYHSVEDHWQIPLLIKEIRPDYKIYIRHYHYMGIETVVYAI